MESNKKIHCSIFSKHTIIKLNNLDVFKYLKLIFEAYTCSQNLDLKAYLPWNPTIQQICGK